MIARNIWLKKLGTAFAIVICFCAALSLADQSKSTAKPNRFMSRAVQFITPDKAIEFLSRAGLGTASRIPGTDMILVTGEPGELTKATTVLEIVDSNQPYVVEILPVVTGGDEQPVYEQLAGRIKDMSMGNFREPPAGDNKPKALVDTYKGSMIVVTEAARLESVISTLEDILAEKKPAKISLPDETAASEPADMNQAVIVEQDANTAGNDKFFGELLDSLAEAEKIEAELKIAQPQPEQPLAEQQPRPEPVSSQPQAEPVAPKLERSKTVDLDIESDEPAFEKFSYEPQKVELADETIELDLPEALNIVDLIDLVGKHLDLDLLYDPAEVKGMVTLRVQNKIKVGELYPLLESVLRFRGFVMSRKGNLVTIVPAAKAIEIDPVLLDGQKGPLQYGDVIVTRVFNLRYIDTASAENLLKNMKLGVNVSPIAEAKKLIVTGYTYRMSRVEELLSMIDKPGELKQFRYRQLRYTMAPSLASQIKTLAEQLGTISVTVAEESKPTPAPRTRGRRPAPKPAPKPTSTQSSTGTSSVYLDADERTNRILMVGLKEQLDIVEKLVDTLDVEQQDLRTLRLYDIQYVGAEEVQDKLAELGITAAPARRTERSTTDRRRITQSRQPQKPGEPAAETDVEVTKEGLVEKPLVVIIESTNSLLVNATAEQHGQIATIIAYVDAEPEQAATNYVVYPLENQDPVELAGVLNQLIQETVEQTQDKDSKIVKTTQRRIEDDITIIAEPTTYSIVVYASKKHQQWVSSLIKQLDEYRPQVLLDVTLVQITKDDAFNFDLDLLSAIPDMGYVSGQTENVTTTIFDLLRADESHRGKFLEGQSIKGDFKGFFGDEKINALLTAVENKKYGRILDRPKLLVNDNQAGTISTTKTTYIERKETSVVGTEGQNTVEEIIFDDYSAGISLSIKPHISTGDMLRLEIKLNRSGFEGSLEGLTKPPNKVDSDIETVVTIPNKSTIILGGVEKVTDSKGGKKVPILGDLPIIGGAFREVARGGNQDKLYIFVKAHILRPGSDLGLTDLKNVSGENRRRFEALESEMQEYEEWPGAKPKPLDPLKVLEED